jgi:hypothetical protein
LPIQAHQTWTLTTTSGGYDWRRNEVKATTDGTLVAANSPRRPAPDPATLLKLWQGWEPERPELQIRLYPRKASPRTQPTEGRVA